MALKDISDLQVCRAILLMRARLAKTIDTGHRPDGPQWADDFLQEMTSQPRKVCERALERAADRDLIECGMWLRGGWLTEDGEALVLASGTDADKDMLSADIERRGRRREG